MDDTDTDDSFHSQFGQSQQKIFSISSLKSLLREKLSIVYNHVLDRVVGNNGDLEIM